MDVEEPWWVRHWRGLALVGGSTVAVGIGIYLWRKIQTSLACAQLAADLDEATACLDSSDYRGMLWSALSFKNSAKQFVDHDRFERISIAYQFIYIASIHCFDYHRAYKHAMKLRKVYEDLKTDSLAIRVLTVFANHDFDLVSECFNELTQNGKHSVECYTAMEIAELRRRQPEKAIEYVRRAIDLSQQASTQHSVASTGELLIAQILKEQGKYDESRALLQQLLGDPSNPSPECLLAVVEAELGNLAEGEDIFKKILRAVKDEFTYTFVLGAMMDFYWKFGMEKKASKAMKKIRRSSAVPPIAHSQWLDTRYCGFLWKDKPEDDIYVDIIYCIVLDVKWCIPDSLWLETHFERPQKEDDPFIVESPLNYAELQQQRFWKMLLIKSPPVVGIKAGGRYMITVKVYSDESKKELLCVHRQLIANNFPVNKLTKKTARDIMRADFELL